MDFLSKALTAIKDGYLRVIQWVDDHPHVALWGATAALIVALVF